MEIGSLFLILSLLVLVGLFVGRPLLDKQNLPISEQDEHRDHLLSTLLAERDQVLHALHELDLDYSLGKIPDVDYPQDRAVLLERGARILYELDQIQGASIEGSPVIVDNLEGGDVPDFQVQQEPGFEAVAVGPQTMSAQPNGSRRVFSSPDDDLEVMLANRRRMRQEKAAGFCPRCGNAIHKADQFCPKCGHKLG